MYSAPAVSIHCMPPLAVAAQPQHADTFHQSKQLHESQLLAAVSVQPAACCLSPHCFPPPAKPSGSAPQWPQASGCCPVASVALWPHQTTWPSAFNLSPKVPGSHPWQPPLAPSWHQPTGSPCSLPRPLAPCPAPTCPRPRPGPSHRPAPRPRRPPRRQTRPLQTHRSLLQCRMGQCLQR